MGKAIQDAINIEKIFIASDKVIPKTNINFISPPPRDSFLNILFPNFIIRNITINIISPQPIDFKTPMNPKLKKLKTTIKLPATANISSGITK